MRSRGPIFLRVKGQCPFDLESHSRIACRSKFLPSRVVTGSLINDKVIGQMNSSGMFSISSKVLSCMVRCRCDGGDRFVSKHILSPGCFGWFALFAFSAPSMSFLRDYCPLPCSIDGKVLCQRSSHFQRHCIFPESRNDSDVSSIDVQCPSDAEMSPPRSLVGDLDIPVQYI